MAGEHQPSVAAFATYEEAVAYLFAMVDYEKITKYKYDLAAFDLSRTERLLAAIGNPHRTSGRLVHVAGTKGKGSTSAMVQTVLTGLGYRTGLFTSPHLVRLEERIQIDGRLIPREEVRRGVSEMRSYVDEIRATRPEESPTFFELVTALGFSYFARERVDFAVIEVGMGGRLDSTNVIWPEVSVITRIDYDHVRRLGPTLAKIAGEKAGIIKKGIPVVSSPQTPEAGAVIQAKAAEQGSELFILGRDARLARVESFFAPGMAGCRFSLEGLNRSYPVLEVPLLGTHQAENAATAVMALEVLERRGLVTLDAATVWRFLARVRFPARIEVIPQSPGEPLTILDGGHNPAAVRALRGVLEAHIIPRLRQSGGRLLLILGVAADKDIEGILREVVPLASAVFFTRSDSPRAADPRELRDMALGLTSAPMHVFELASEALGAARAVARPEDVICITGSLYLAGLLRPHLVPQEYATEP